MDAIIDSIYRAAIGEVDRDRVLGQLVNAFNATDIHILTYDQRYSELVESYIYDNKSVEELFFQEFASADEIPAVDYFRTHPDREFAIDEDFSADVYKRFAHFYDFVGKFDATHRVGHRFVRDDDLAGTLWILRSRKIGPADRTDLERLEALAPHVRHGLEIVRTLGAQGSAGEAIVSAMESLRTAAVIVDWNCRILRVNAAFETLAAKETHILAAGRVLRAQMRPEHRKLANSIWNATRSVDGIRASNVFLGGQKAEEVYQATIAPMVDPERFLLPARNFALVLFKPAGAAKTVLPPEARLFFGLSDAEADIALAIAGGQTLPEIASRRRTSTETVRAQAKAARDKLGLARNIDVARMIQDLGWTDSQTDS